MIGDIDVYGVLVPPLLLWVLAALPLAIVLRRLLAAIGFYRLVWHRPLFDLSLTVIMTGVVAAVSLHWLVP